ncbi:hypothetical protein EJD97_003517 [Solanum chilense]|uniref:Putative plant transposon protein domain-containing protein n=1 Tax=Solanum chilense TaxID=4083 RepID=A0A6N2BXX4_SOLCI|nr:hypothetical protein EJD97_003517 [Solanum chilense]
MVIDSDDDRHPEYVPPGTSTPSRAARTARATPKKVASSVFTASQSDEERTLTGTSSGSATNEEGASGSLEVSWSEEAYASAEIDRRAAPAKQAPMEQVRLRGVQVDISLPAIGRFLYGEGVDVTRTPLTAEFDYRWQIVKDGQFLCEPSLIETTKRWMALHLSVYGEGADWVTEPKGSIKKANLTFTAKFWWLDRVVLMAAMIAGFEVDFAWLLQAVMHERAFKVTTTYPFPCMIFAPCMSAGVPLWHVDKLKTPEPRPARLHRRRPLTLPRSSLSRVVALPRAPLDTTPLPALVPLARVQKLEAQKGHTSASYPAVDFTERKIAEVNQLLDTFELRVLARPAPPVDMSTLQAAVDSLRADIDTILEDRVPESEAPSVEPAKDIVLATLFATSEIPPPPPRESAKRRRGQAEDEARARKKERRDIEAAMRASLAEEEAH